MVATSLIVLVGIWTGAIATIAWERLPIWHRLEPVPRAVDFRRTLYRMDPSMPIVAGVIIILGIAYALQIEGPDRTLAWAGTGGIALIVVGSILLLEPINSQFRRLPEGTAPSGAAALYVRWSWLHLGRTAVAVASLILFALAVLS